MVFSLLMCLDREKMEIPLSTSTSNLNLKPENKLNTWAT